tara:strand:- start:5974 stop:6168 length:195 start_codon:yes stop_codon:yes gene_type:complete
MKADTNVKKETTIIIVWRVIKLIMLIEIKLALLLSISIDFITIKAEVKIDININELPKKLSIIP